MARDVSRFRFNPKRRFSGVVKQQGRVQLDSDSSWVYVLLRRVLIFLEQSVSAGLQWAGFEPKKRWWKLRARRRGSRRSRR